MKTRLLLSGLLCILFGVLTAQQYAAFRYAYHPSLGWEAFSYQGVPVYWPGALFGWYARYGARDVNLYRASALIGGATALGLAALCYLLASHCSRQPPTQTSHGTARWADLEDVKKMGLMGEDYTRLGFVSQNHQNGPPEKSPKPYGIVLGKFQKQTLVHHGEEHVLLVGPPRTGKGAGVIVPTLLSYQASCLIHDIKGENYAITGKWRSTFSRVLAFEPTSSVSTRYNPLAEVRLGENEVRDAQNVADILVDPDGSRDRRDHWEKTSHSLLVGTILHVLYSRQDKTLAGVSRFLADPHRTFDDTLEEMINSNHPVIVSVARELHNKSSNELSGVLSTAMSFLGLYRDPVIANATSASDFRISDLRDGKEPVSLYLIIPPSDLSRTRPLIRMMLNQIMRRLTEQIDPRSRPLLLVLDEFPALGRLDFFEQELAYLPGYGIRALVAAQSLNQIDRHYGRDNTVMDACQTRVIFAPNDDHTARRISSLLGQATVEAESHTRRREFLELVHDMKYANVSHTGRPLLTPGEVGQLGKDDEIVMVAGYPPILARKIRYWEEKEYKGKAI